MKWPSLALVLAAVLSVPKLGAGTRKPIGVVDLHVDLPYRTIYKQAHFAEGSGEFEASRLVTSGASGVVLPLFVPKGALPHGRTEGELERSYARVFGALLETPPYSLPGCGVQRAGVERREVETWLAFEGAGQLEPDARVLRRWSLRGVRSFGLVHAEHNELATSSGEPNPSGAGLTERGRRFVHVTYDVGGIVDVSHASDEATNEVLAIAEALGRPVLATHSNARALADHPRNLTDAQIRSIGRLGGVIGVNFHGRFLNPKTGRGALRDVVQQVRHLAAVGGPGVVAIGSDFEGGIRPAAGLESVQGYPTLARALRADGHDEETVQAFLGGNARRVLCGARK